MSGDLISEGSKGFPPPESSAGTPRFSDLNVPDLGLVRIRYEASSFSHYRSRFWRWGAMWADRIDAQGNVIAPD